MSGSESRPGYHFRRAWLALSLDAQQKLHSIYDGMDELGIDSIHLRVQRAERLHIA